MSMKTGDRIVAPSRGDATTAVRYGEAGAADRIEDVDDYVYEVYRLCAQDGMIDASIVVGQSLQETSDPGPWQSFWWNERLNPAGMGITGDPDQNEASPTFRTGEEAARAQVAHLLLYATGEIDRGGLTPADDPRYDAYVEAYGNRAVATTIAGLATTWAVDPEYATGICRNGNACFPGLPDQGDENGGGDVGEIVFGRVPMPEYADRIIPTPPQQAWDDLGPRDVKAIVYHRMLGSLPGTDSYFRQPGCQALTDWGLGVAAQDGASLAGVLYRWNDPLGRRSPWASGPVSAPYGDGKKFVDIYGVNGVNRFSTALEISGQQATPLDDPSREAIVALSAYYADRYEIPWNAYPIVEGENRRSFIIWHEEFCQGTGKACPFDVVKAETDALIAATADRLKQYQTGGGDGGDVAPPDTTYPAARIAVVPESQGFELTTECPGRYRCIQGTTFRTYPNREAPAGTETPAQAGKTYSFPYSTEVDDELWLVSKAGSWALAKAFEPE